MKKISIFLIIFTKLAFGGYTEDGLAALESGDHEKAILFFDKGCRNKEDYSCENMGHYYRFGIIVNMDFERSKEYYIKACNLGWDNGCMLEEDMKTRPSADQVKQALSLEFKKSIEFLTKYCSAGNIISCEALAEELINSKNLKNATYVIARGCNLGSEKLCKFVEKIASNTISELDQKKHTQKDTKYAHRFYRDSLKNIVIDPTFNLMWQDDYVSVKKDLQSAKLYCENLSYAGYTDWRLPSVNELISIIDYDKKENIIINSAFKYIANNEDPAYWSSTMLIGSSSYAWHVKFGSGSVRNAGDISNSNYVRCVR